MDKNDSNTNNLSGRVKESSKIKLSISAKIIHSNINIKKKDKRINRRKKISHYINDLRNLKVSIVMKDSCI